MSIIISERSKALVTTERRLVDLLLTLNEEPVNLKVENEACFICKIPFMTYGADKLFSTRKIDDEHV